MSIYNEDIVSVSFTKHGSNIVSASYRLSVNLTEPSYQSEQI